MEKMVQSIIAELLLRKDETQEPINTIYFGGGTPSLLDQSQLNLIIKAISDSYEWNEQIELTIEANPEDLSLEKCIALKALGFNRVSLGVQSFDDNVLTFLNRNHNAEQVKQACDHLTSVNIDNINMDLIYGIPDQSMATWRENLLKMIALKPNHISAYALTIEDKTVFGNWSAKGRLIPVTEDEAAEQFELLVALLTKAGYEHYEVSNFALPGQQSKHNSAYWQQETYLGIGPGAHSYNGKTRKFNVSNNAQYIKALTSGLLPSTAETLSKEERINEYLLTGLRTKFGIDLAYMATQFGYRFSAHQEHFLEDIFNRGLAETDSGKIKLTSQGLLIADSIVVELMPSEV